MAGREWAVGAVAFILLGVSIYFFVNSMNLMTAEPPRVAASLLAAMIGLASLASSVTLFRTWVLARALAERER